MEKPNKSDTEAGWRSESVKQLDGAERHGREGPVRTCKYQRSDKGNARIGVVYGCGLELYKFILNKIENDLSNIYLELSDGNIVD